MASSGHFYPQTCWYQPDEAPVQQQPEALDMLVELLTAPWNENGATATSAKRPFIVWLKSSL
jgi:hypothetical protein